jgi:hypothetical protein
MATNRYTEISPSAYTPQTMQELAFVPMLKRQKHDALLAQQQEIIGGLAKVDPLDVHLEEAAKLKNNIESKIDQQASDLATNGFNNDMVGKTIALNREYQNLVAPTGRIGQINNAKKVYMENRKDFLEDATKTKGWSMERALNAWNDFSSKDKYTGFDSQNNISNIGLLGAPKKIETLDKLKSVHDLLGEQVTGEMRANGYSFAQGPFGGMIMVDRSGRRIETSNKPNLQSALGLLQNQFGEKEWSDSRKFEGANDANVQSQLVNGVNSMLKTGVVDNRGENAQFIGDPNAKKKEDKAEPSGIFDPDSTHTLTGRINDVDVSQIGKSKVGFSYALANSHTGLQGRNTPYKPGENPNKYTYKDIFDDKLSQRAYEVAVNKLKSSHKLPSNADLNDPKTAAAASEYMKKYMDKLTIGNDILRPDTTGEDQLFMGELSGKAPADRDQQLTLDTKAGLRPMIDIKTGEKITLGDGEKVQYIGYDSPVNYNNYKFENNKEQSVMAHRALVVDKDGNPVHKVAIGRTLNEIAKPEFKRAYEINQVYKNAVQKFGDWVTATGRYSGNENLKGTQIRYNEDGTIDMRKGNAKAEKLSPAEFSTEMEDLMTGK